jgi:hypothetical protein
MDTMTEHELELASPVVKPGSPTRVAVKTTEKPERQRA